MNKNFTLEYNTLKVNIQSFMLEITTGVGCIVNCKFCPQKTFLKAYKSDNKLLSFNNFKYALEKLPSNTIIIFSGFSEPFLNNECSKMILHASKNLHPVSVFTTGTGMTVEDVYAIKDIPFSAFPHGGFVLHLADNEGYANINVNESYLRLLNTIKEANIHNILLRTMGTLHTKIRDIFPQELVQTQTMNSRAGYLTDEGVNVDRCACIHTGKVICGRDEYIYNNVLLPNGDVALCCQDFGLNHILGNLFEETYEKIVPEPLASFELCKSCHNAIDIPRNFPNFHFMNK